MLKENSFSLLAADDKVWDFMSPDGEGFNGTPFGGRWKPQLFYLEEPIIPRPNFFNIGTSAFACDEKARELAGEAMEMSGEFLPIRIEGVKGKFWIYNITKCLNVLDPKKSKWRNLGPGLDGTPGRLLEKPAFIPERFGEELLFKIPEDRGARMYCIEHTGDPDDGEFKAVVEEHGLTGLEFTPLWRSKNK